jgi:hypothetical protein
VCAVDGTAANGMRWDRRKKFGYARQMARSHGNAQVRAPLFGVHRLIVLLGLVACTHTTSTPDKTPQEHAQRAREERARGLHNQLAKCRERPHHFCPACLNNEPIFLNEQDEGAFLEICRNVVAQRRCAPGFESPNLPANVRRAACDEATWGQMNDAETEQEADEESVERASPPDPSPEEQQRLKRDLVRTIEKVDEEDAAKARNAE